jgi:hypothetical protein
MGGLAQGKTQLRRVAAATFIAGALAAPVHAQTSVSATVGDRVDSTAHGGDAEAGHAPALSIEVGRGVKDGRARVFYGLDTGTFSTPGDWFYQAHSAGLTARLATSGTRGLLVGATATWRGNGEAWREARYGALGGFATVSASNGSRTLRAGYRLDRRWFFDIPGLDQLEHGAFAGIQAAVQKTRTTLLAELQAGLKHYNGERAASAVAVADSAASQRRRGWSRGMGPQLRPTAAPLEVVSSEGSAGRLQVYGRIAQSLGDRTAVSFEASVRSLFGDVPPALIATPELLVDDGVYDDPFASEAVTWRAGVKRVTGGGAELEAGLGRWRKDYTGTLAVDAAGVALAPETLRADRAWRADAQATLPLWPTRTGGWELDLVVGYLYGRHASNDAFYAYRTHRAAVALSVAY